MTFPAEASLLLVVVVLVGVVAYDVLLGRHHIFTPVTCVVEGIKRALRASTRPLLGNPEVPSLRLGCPASGLSSIRPAIGMRCKVCGGPWNRGPELLCAAHSDARLDRGDGWREGWDLEGDER